MPSSGYPIVSLIRTQKDARLLESCAKHAMKTGLFAEWLESFIGAYNAGASFAACCNAGLIEWDM